MALAVPLSRFTSRVGGGSAFFVRPTTRHETFPEVFRRLEPILFCSVSCLCLAGLFERTIIGGILAAETWRRSAGLYAHHHFRLHHQLFCLSYRLVDSSRQKDWTAAFHFHAHHVFHRALFVEIFGKHMIMVLHRRPNKSPEPTAVGACSSAIAVHVASRRWLSFLR